MPLLTHYASFFVSPFGEKSVTDELNAFLQSNRIVNREKRLIDGDRGTGWVFLVEYAAGVEIGVFKGVDTVIAADGFLSSRATARSVAIHETKS